MLMPSIVLLILNIIIGHVGIERSNTALNGGNNIRRSPDQMNRYHGSIVLISRCLVFTIAPLARVRGGGGGAVAVAHHKVGVHQARKVGGVAGRDGGHERP